MTSHLEKRIMEVAIKIGTPEEPTLTCEEAQKIATDEGVANGEVRKICKRLKISLLDCKLGCS